MTLESVFISTLLLADLTIPPQALEALGFHFVRNILWCSNCVGGMNVNGFRKRPKI